MGVKGRVKGPRRFVPDPAGGVQSVTLQKPIHFGEKRQDVREGCGRKDDTRTQELQPLTRVRIVNNHSVHAGNPS
jgi:hypothetical protein